MKRKANLAPSARVAGSRSQAAGARTRTAPRAADADCTARRGPCRASERAAHHGPNAARVRRYVRGQCHLSAQGGQCHLSVQGGQCHLSVQGLRLRVIPAHLLPPQHPAPPRPPPPPRTPHPPLIHRTARYKAQLGLKGWAGGGIVAAVAAHTTRNRRASLGNATRTPARRRAVHRRHTSRPQLVLAATPSRRCRCVNGSVLPC